MRIALMDSHDNVLLFLDNDVPEALHYSAATLSTYLNGNAYTMAFTVATAEEGSDKIREGCKISFRLYRSEAGGSGSDYKDYYLTIVRVERDEESVVVEAWGLTLELTNEEVGTADVPQDMTIDGYLGTLGFEKDVLEVDTSRVKNDVRRIKFESRDTILRRIYDLAAAYDAEAGFDIRLKPNYQLDKIRLTFYKAGEKKGLGQDRTAEVIRYGSNVTSIKKTADISELFTGIRPRGKTSTVTTTEDKTTYTYSNGVVRTVEKVTVKDDQKEETREIEAVGKWSKTTIKVVFTETDGRKTTTTKDYETGKKPKLPSGNPTQVKMPTKKTEKETTLTLSGFPMTSTDENGSYVVMGEDIKCPEARDRFPASLKKNSAGAFADGYVIRYLDASDCEDQGSLYEKGLKALKESCVPKVSYEMTGYIPGNVGDWVMVEDSQYDPPVYLQCRIIEQEINLIEPWLSKSTFDNFTTIESQLSSAILTRSAQMAAAIAQYDVSISSPDGTIYEDDSVHTFTAAARDNGINITDSVSIIWSLNGVDLPGSDSRVTGKTIKISTADIDKSAILSCRVVKDGKTRGSCQVTLQSFYLPTIEQTVNSDGSVTITTQSNKVVTQSTLFQGAAGPAGKDGADGANGTTFTPSVSSSGVLSWTNDGGLSNPAAVNIKGKDGKDGTNGAPGEKGEPGTPGKDAPTIKSITGYYYRSTSQSTVPADSSFSTSRPTLTATYKYLWMYDRYTMSDGTTLNGPKHIAAVYGDTGQMGSSAKTINGISTVWATGAVPPTYAPRDSSFSDAKSSSYAYSSLWRAEKISYSDGSSLITNKRCVYWFESVNPNESDSFVSYVNLIRTEHNGILQFRGYTRAASSGNSCTFNLPDLNGISFAWGNYFTTKHNSLSTAIEIELSSGGVLKVTASGALSTSNHLDFEIPIIIP